MKTVVIVVGTRPEVIKMAPLVMELRKSSTLRPVLLSTGQHRQMLDQALAAFDLRPDFDLELMQPGQTLTDLTARVIVSVGNFLQKQKPDALLVQGDTTTVLASALAAAYARVPVGHVEAGLRTYNFDAPWPEEMNRRLTSPLCRWSFVPTERSRANLIAERIPAERCFVTGNTVIDALLWMRDKIQTNGTTTGDISEKLGIPSHFANRYLSTADARWILVTGHRRESFGSGFEGICQSILRLTEENRELGVLYPVHLNPQVREPVQRLLGQHERIALIEPVGYEDFIWLMSRCYFLLSDSGGVQEEAPSLGKPVLVMRDTTERPEGVDAGTCRLVGTSPERICAEAKHLLDDSLEYNRRSNLANPYGDGTAARKIREILESELNVFANDITRII